MTPPTDVEQNTITGVRLDIARLEGMLTQFLTDGVRRIDNNEKATAQIRTDLTAVKDETNRKIEATNINVQKNTSAIEEVKTDIKEVKDKQNGSWNKVWTVLAFAVSGVMAVWNIVGK